MTIEEMRSSMREKVVPEEVVPQNVINCLIDDEAQPPKLDAFAFLTRLRALGIGSADFLNLLQGCGAPQSVTERIKQNPAMNLQGLVMTLENSELDSDDYTRMLLTARQVWERTLTMRLEKSERLSRNIEQLDEPEQEPVEVSPVIEEFDDYDEDMCELSFTAVFDKINEEMREGDDNAESHSELADGNLEPNECVVPEMSTEDYQIGATTDNEQLTDDPTMAEVFDKISSELDETNAPESNDSDMHSGENAASIFDEAEFDSEEADSEVDDDEMSELTFTQAFDKIKSKKSVKNELDDNEADSSEESFADNSENSGNAAVSDTTMLVQIDEEMLRENFEKLAEKAHKEKIEKEKSEKAKSEKVKRSKDEKSGKTVSEKQSNSPKTAKQSPAKVQKPKEQPKDAEPLKEEPVEKPGSFDENNESTADIEERGGKIYHKKALVSAAVGAAALLCAAYFIGARVGANDAKALHYAKDNSEIFNKIYEAYSDNVPGGSEADEVNRSEAALFGDLVLDSGDVKSIGNFALNTDVYSVTEEAVSASIINNGVVIPREDIVPPESTHFVAAFDNNGELYALFSGKRSGFMKIRGGTEDYTVLQDGVLTDYDFSDGQIKLGTVYTPIFDHTFTLNDENVYLPKTGVEIEGEEKLTSVPAKNIIISSAKGYSYGVSAGYSTDSGKTSDAVAVMGDPVAASADGRFALNGNKGLLLKAEDEKISSQTSELMSHAAFGKKGCAVAEESESGKVKIFGDDFKVKSMLTGVSEKIGAMWFNGDVLTVTDESDGILRVDCAKVEAPKPITLKMANGIILGDSTLTCQTQDGKLTITRSDLKNGVCEKHSEYVKELPEEQLQSVKLGDSRSALTDDDTTGISYSYFDGVSVISEYVVFTKDAPPKTVSVYDDKTGFTAAFKMGSEINAVCADGIKVPK